MKIYCCACKAEVEARLTDGREIYPHRVDLTMLPFWRCDACGNYVGCHHKTKDPTRPLGTIADAPMKNARQHLHRVIDPIWQSGKMTRKEIYLSMSKYLGWKYHTAELRTIEEARQAFKVAVEIKQLASA